MSFDSAEYNYVAWWIGMKDFPEKNNLRANSHETPSELLFSTNLRVSSTAIIYR